MRIHKFSPYLKDLIRNECDFTDFERQCFEYKVEQYTDYRIASELFTSESTVAKTMRVVRNKIFEVMQDHLEQPLYTNNQNQGGCGHCIVCHTMNEWAKIPDYLSNKGTLYVYLDYRTENDEDIPRIKIGDGVRPISELPFATMSITDKDMEYWDNKPDTDNNNFGKVIVIDTYYSEDNKFVCPTDGYIMLEFEIAEAFAAVNIYGASEQSYFVFEKKQGIDIHSKEVFVKKGMRCEFVNCSTHAEIKFMPLV